MRGVVQGVGFRKFVAARAKELRLAGAVRNEADGSVVGRAIGPPAALARLEALLRRGPSRARVTALAVSPPAPPRPDDPPAGAPFVVTTTDRAPPGARDAPGDDA